MNVNVLRELLARWAFSPLQGTTLSNWWRALRDNRFAMHPAYIPRAALTGLAALFNSAQSRVEERRFADRWDAIQVQRPLFVLGHYRSGTTHLHNLLAQDPRLAYPNYFQATFPRTFLTTEALTGRVAQAFALRKRPQDDVAIDVRATAEDELALCSDTLLSTHMMWHFPRRARSYGRYLSFESVSPAGRDRWKRSLRDFAGKLALRYEGRTLVFKSPCHTARIRLIREAFPDARFIHVHRDPFEVFQSTRLMERRVAPFFQFQRADPGERDERILWRYRTMYETFLAQRPQVPDDSWCEVGYADLVRDPLPALRRVYEHLDLPPFDNVERFTRPYLERVRCFRVNVHATLDTALRQRIGRDWSMVFEALGYSTQRSTAITPR